MEGSVEREFLASASVLYSTFSLKFLFLYLILRDLDQFPIPWVWRNLSLGILLFYYNSKYHVPLFAKYEEILYLNHLI